MIQRYNNLSLVLGVPGLILQILGNYIGRTSEGPVALLGLTVGVTGTVMLIAGLSYYAIAKGRSGWWGLCGFLSCIGLLILALLKDERPNG